MVFARNATDRMDTLLFSLETRKIFYVSNGTIPLFDRGPVFYIFDSVLGSVPLRDFASFNPSDVYSRKHYAPIRPAIAAER